MNVWFSLLGWLLSIFTVTGNGFVIFVVAKTRRLHNSSNWFVLSLAIADFCVGLVVFPVGFSCYNNLILCNLRVWTSFHWFFLHASVANLCTLTWDRYIAIIHPLRYNSSIFKRRPIVVILSAWVTSFLVSLSLVVVMYATTSETVLKAMRLIGVSGFDVICCALLLYAVVRILVVARGQSQQDDAMKRQIQLNQSSTNESTITSGRPRRRNNTSSFIAVIVLFFLSCYGAITYLVVCLAFSWCDGEVAAKAVTLLVVFNSTVNPLVYAFLKEDMKTELLKLVCCKSVHSRHTGSDRSERTSQITSAENVL